MLGDWVRVKDCDILAVAVQLDDCSCVEVSVPLVVRLADNVGLDVDCPLSVRVAVPLADVV